MKAKREKGYVVGFRLKASDLKRVEKSAAKEKQKVSDWVRAAVINAFGIDYRALLLKYMQCCIECDGGTHLMCEYPDGLLSAQEIAELESIAELAKSARGVPDRPFVSPPESTDIVTCQQCGYSREIRRIPQFNAPSLPGADEGCPHCETKRLVKLQLNPILPVPSESILCPECGWTRQVPRRQIGCVVLPGEDPGCPLCAARLGLTPQEVIESAVTIGRGFMIPIETISREEFAARYPPKRSWPSEFSAMDQMEPSEAMGRFKELLAGRALPKGFAKMPRPEQVKWLEGNCPL